MRVILSLCFFLFPDGVDHQKDDKNFGERVWMLHHNITITSLCPEKELYKNIITSLRDQFVYNSVRGVRAIVSNIRRGNDDTKIPSFQAL